MDSCSSLKSGSECDCNLRSTEAFTSFQVLSESVMYFAFLLKGT